MANSLRKGLLLTARCVAATGVITIVVQETKQQNQYSVPSNGYRIPLLKWFPMTYCENYGGFPVEVPRPAGFTKQEDFSELWNYNSHFFKCTELANKNMSVILDEVEGNPEKYPAFAQACDKFDHLNIFTKYYRQAKGFIGLNIDLAKIGMSVQPHYNEVSKVFQELNDEQKLTIVNRGVLINGSINQEEMEEIVYRLDSLMALSVIEMIQAEIKHLSACFGNEEVEEELLNAAELILQFEEYFEDEDDDDEEESEEDGGSTGEDKRPSSSENIGRNNRRSD